MDRLGPRVYNSQIQACEVWAYGSEMLSREFGCFWARVLFSAGAGAGGLFPMGLSGLKNTTFGRGAFLVQPGPEGNHYTPAQGTCEIGSNRLMVEEPAVKAIWHFL